MAGEPTAAGDAIPQACRIIEVRVAELRQLFNAIDPSPFHERDLDPRAEEFIVGWSKDLPAEAPLALVVYLDRPAGRTDEAAVLRDAMREFFGQRAEATRRKLRELFSRGRISLMIGLAFLTLSIVVGDVIADAFAESGLAQILRESFLIGGWVAMWRPLEVFLYDWWPIRAEARLFDRLAAMPVRIVYTGRETPGAWRADWPAVRAGEPRAAANDAADRRLAATRSRPDAHRHTPEEERTIREAALDDTIEGSFPASDPPSSNPNPDDHDAVRRGVTGSHP